MKQVKVLHIITRLDPGGSTENTLTTAAGLNGFSSTLLYGKTAHLPPRALALKGKVKIQEIPELVRKISPHKDLIAFYKLWKFIRHGCFTIVHTHSSKAGILGRWGAWLAHTPIVVHTPHGHVFYGYFGRWATTLFIWIERITALLTDRIVTLTEKEKQEHVQFGIARAEKFTTIPSGVDLRSVQSPKSEVQSLKTLDLGPPGSLLVGAVGRFEPIKGHRYLVKAIPLILQDIPEATFLFIGEGPLREELERQAARLDVASRVFFTGWQKEPTELMALCDLIVFPSLNEGMGRVLVEAMALGKAVVASAVGGVVDLVQDGKNGLLVPPADSVSLAHAITMLLADKEKRESLGAEGRKMAPAFSVEVMLERIEKLYRELMEQKRLTGN